MPDALSEEKGVTGLEVILLFVLLEQVPQQARLPVNLEERLRGIPQRLTVDYLT